MFQVGDVLVRRDKQYGNHRVVAIVSDACNPLVLRRDDGHIVSRKLDGKFLSSGREDFADVMKPKIKHSVTWYQNIYRSGSVSSFHDKASAERFASHRDAVAVAKPYTYEWEE